jgi:hypothetical protein
MSWDFEISQGTHRTMRLTLLDEDENPLELEKVWVTVKRLRADAEAKALTSKNSHDGATPTPDDIQIVAPATAGRADVKFVPADTAGIKAGDYWWDCKAKTIAGQILDPVREAKFTVTAAVTQRAS